MADVVAPVAEEYLPATQFKQVSIEVAPMLEEYLPRPHNEQVADEVAPKAEEYLPSLHPVHATVPVTVLYFPAAHAAHVPPSGPVNPRLQTQLVNAVDPRPD